MTRWIEARGEFTRDARGQALQLKGTFQDLTELKAANQAVTTLQQRQQAMLDALPDLLFEVDADGRLLDYHTHRGDLLAATPEHFPGKLMADVLPAEATAVCRLAMEEAARDGHSTGRRYSLDLPQGRRWFELSVAPLRDRAESAQSFVLIARDVSARQEAEQQLELAGRVFHHAREGILVTDAKGDIVDVNEAFSVITGYPREEALGRNPRFLSSGQQGQAFYAELWRSLLDTGGWSGEVWNRRRSGEVYAQSMTISTVRGAQGEVLHHVALISDITAAKRHQAELEHAAHFDALTGLPNRLLLSDRLHQAMTQTARRSTTLAVAYLDLDGFKQVNDRHGHATGDKLLVHVAQRLHAAMREGDTLARIGGDEFVVVLIDLPDPGSADALVERLLRVAAEPVEIGELTLSATASIGLTHFPQAEPVAPDQLIRQADQAMYKAKLAGKSRHATFDARLDSEARRHHASLVEIRQALQREEFVLHFQPKVNLRRGTVIGAEALIRWQHPQRGLLPPGEFLPQLEHEALAVDLGDWVLRRALAQHELWLDEGLRLPVGVNVSAPHLLHPDFVPHLRRHLAAHPRVHPSQLTLEILETSALNDLAQAADVIEACRQLGVEFELDDFGTGYSSLTYLRQLAVAGIKIDQSFVRNLLASHEDQTILRGILGLAQAFGMSVIAEGVETVAHGGLLLSLGCESAQGYGIARPMPAERLPGWVQDWRPDPSWAAIDPA
ncbi:MAG: EAL domain-containing protein [Burkholderiales bacterium]|nr:EAL domain-containing protein [Burkholderiales bacterium]